MRNKIYKKGKSSLSFLFKLIVLVYFLGSQSFVSEIFLYKTQAAPFLTTYVVPAISDDKILPKSSISSSYLRDTISIQISHGEYKAASFVVNSTESISALQVTPSALTGDGGTIPSSSLDISAVKCWYRGGSDTGVMVNGRYLTPELLLKDDSLVNVNGDSWTEWNVSNPNGKNYLKVNGSYVDISSDTQRTSAYITSITDRPVQDAASLQTVNLPADYNKQFWITVNVPDGMAPGNYTGTISLKNGDQTLKTLNVNLEVLPIDLPLPNVEYSLYYIGTIYSDGSISSAYKTVQQYTAEQTDMRKHGVTNPTMYPFMSDSNLLQELAIRQQVGMDNTNMYHVIPTGSDADADYISNYKNLTAPYGVVNWYEYGPDEQDLNDSVHRAQIESIHNAGALYFGSQWIASQAEPVADVLDLANVGSELSPSLAAKYHNYGHRIFSYNNPQTVPEYPRLFRMNFGLALWQANYDGAMDYTYQHSAGDIWNDFDYDMRDHVFAFPTMNGVIDTIQWEGFREGVNDMRYLAALQSAIAAGNPNDTTIIEASDYLDNLKTSDLIYQDLDDVRLRMIDYILAIKSSSHYLSVNQGTGCGFYASGKGVAITADVPPANMTFDKWTGDTQYISDVNDSIAMVTMPNRAISVSAAYTNS